MRLIAAFLAMALLTQGAAADPADDAFARAVASVRDGSAAERAHDRGRLRAAVRLLEGSGAHPVEGEDLAERWRARLGSGAAPVFRDRALGPAYRRVALERGGKMRFEQVFLAGQRARIAVVPVRQAGARVAVLDDDGKDVCGAQNSGCNWIPLWTTRFRIDLVNTGKQTGEYIVLIQ